MLRKDHAPLVILVIATLVGAVAGYRTRIALGRHDEPTPLNEVRAEIAVTVDLAPRIACDEVFDLALYTHSGVELITWDGALSLGARSRDSSSCRNRHVVVKYIPGRIRRAVLLERIERLATSMRVE